MEEERVNEEVPPQVEQLSKFLKVDKEFKVLKILPKVIMFLIWKKVLRFRRCLIGRLERFWLL